MNWSEFYLICFVVGFALSALSFLGVHFHLPFHWHPPHGGDLGHFHWGDAHAPHGAHGGTHAQSTMPFFNFATLTAFLAWFGGCGYLLTRFSTFWFVTGLGLSAVVGLLGAWIVFLFMTKVLMSPDENLNPADFRMEGVLGRLILPIREGGTGEIVYSQAGTRRNATARSEDGIAIAKETEVIVTRYERGVAYVRPWDEMAGSLAGDSAGQHDNN